MERESNFQPLQLGTNLDSLAPPGSRIRLALLWLFMLLPWFWVSLGLLVLQDYRLTIAMYELLGCGLPVLIFSGRQWPAIMPFRVKRRWILLTSLVVNTVILGAFQLSQGFGMHWDVFHERMQNTHLSADFQFWTFAMYIVILNPIFEEMFWRGVVYREWQSYVNQNKANLISSVFFGAWHWLVLQTYCDPLWAVLLTICVMIGGSLFAYSYQRTGTLASAIALHALGADLPMVFVVYDCIQQGSHWAKLNLLN